MSPELTEHLAFHVQTPDGKVPPLSVCKALLELAELGHRQMMAKEKEAFRVNLLGLLRQHADAEKKVLDMLKTGMCTPETIEEQVDHVRAILVCISRLDYTPQPIW